jgi:hypothetical protein
MLAGTSSTATNPQDAINNLLSNIQSSDPSSDDTGDSPIPSDDYSTLLSNLQANTTDTQTQGTIDSELNSMTQDNDTSID